MLERKRLAEVSHAFHVTQRQSTTPTGRRGRIPHANRSDKAESVPAPSNVDSIVGAVLDRLRPKLVELEKLGGGRVVLVLGEIDVSTCIIAGKVLRKIGKLEELEVVLESPGGDLDTATKLSKMLRAHCAKLTVTVPFYAKSAASMVAISADAIRMGAYAELGPIDPQVLDPQTGQFVPAHSIVRALDFISATRDNLVKISLAEKLSPILIGGYKDVELATEQEVEEVCRKLADPERAIHTLTSKYLSHGYPLTGDTLKDLGFPVHSLTLEESEPYMALHDDYVSLSHMHGHSDDGKCVTPNVVQTKEFQSAVFEDKFICESLGTPKAS